MNYSIAVWDLTFYKVDEDGNELLNEDGSTKLFYERHSDYTNHAEGLNDDDLEEIK